MLLSRSRLGLVAAAAALLSSSVAKAVQSTQCGELPFHVRTLRTPLNVNPDGAVGSYSFEDHGYTYVSNGMNLVENGRTLACHRANASYCRAVFLRAERMSFGPGSPTFCVYAIEVVPARAGQTLTPCDSRNPERRMIGNGLGRLRVGPSLPTITGNTSPTYASMTSLRHTIAGESVYLDSATVPVLVSPEPSLLGSIAWVRFGGRSTFAILGDSGASFGEGSIALHQRLRYDTMPPAQPLGPIPISERCGPLERGVRAPFMPRADRGDHCRAGYTPQTVADIRGYANIEDPVDVVILEGVRLPMHPRSRLVLTEVTDDAMATAAAAAGFTPDRLRAMVDCSR